MKYLILTVLMIVGCGQKVPDSNSNNGGNLAKVWTASDGSTLDLTNIAPSDLYGDSGALFYTSGSKMCSCSAEFFTATVGDPMGDGDFVLSACTGSTGCSSLNGSGYYQNQNSTLNFCQPLTGATCVEYH